MTKNNTTTNESATTTSATATNRVFRVQKPNPEEYKRLILKTQQHAKVLSAYNYIVRVADIKKYCNYIAVRTPKNKSIESALIFLMNTVGFNPFDKEWVNNNFRYGIIKNTLSEIKRVIDSERKRILLSIPSFYTVKYYEKPIYGFFIIINNDNRYPLFAVDSAKQLDLYFTEGTKLKIGDTSIEVTPIYDDDVLYIMEEVIEAYASASIEKWNEEIINKTILRAIEESFEDDEYI